MNLNVTFKRVWFTWNGTQWVENITTLLPEDMSFLSIKRLDTNYEWVYGVNLTRVPHQDYVTVNLPICTTDALPVLIQGVRTNLLPPDISGYDSGYDDGYTNLTLNGESVSYSNIFEIYGKDEFITIYLVDKTRGYDDGYDLGYNIAPSTYSNYHAIRKPFTNQIHFYDTTSSEWNGRGKIKWYVQSQANNTSLEDYTGQVITTRNTMICSEASFYMNVKKELYLDAYVPYNPCNCNGNGYTHTTILAEEWLTEKQVDRQGKYFGWEIDTKVDSNLKLFAQIAYYNNLSKNEVYTYIDYGLEQVLVNGELKYLLDYDFLEEQLIDYKGITIDTRTQYISEFNTYSPTAWQIEVPQEGDYMIKTKLSSYSCGKLVREVEYVTNIVANRYVKFIKEPCAVTITNLAFEPISVKVSKLQEKKGVYTFIQIDEFTIQHLDNREYKEGSDGIYKYEVSRLNLNVNPDIDTYIHINYCEVQKCMQSVIEEIMCKDLCKEKDFALFNIITVLHQTLMLKIQDEYKIDYWEKEYYTLLEDGKLTELYTIHQLLDRLNRYCYDCKGLSLSDCNC